LPIDTEKLIKTKGLFLVNPARVSIQDSQVAALFGCLSFITAFVEDSFDVAVGFFSFEKNVSRGPRDFSGHFLGSREDGRLVFAWFWGPGAREGSFGVTNQKRDILVAV
jgi:hypothetical protein